MIPLDHSGIRAKLILQENAKIGDAVRLLNDHGLRMVLIEGKQGELQGVITDGDIRRGLIRGLTLESPIIGVVKTKPLVVTKEVNSGLARQIMVANKIFHIPVVEPDGKLIGIHLMDMESAKPERKEQFVIMAGGRGTRLWPHTENCPKPMLPVNGKPMLQHIIERACEEGFSRFILAINYLGSMIEEYFGKGKKIGVEIEYLREDKPLGTAGALSLILDKLESSFIVTNGDVLTDVKYSEILDFHKRYESRATMAVRQYEWQHPFGVVRTNGMEITGFEEKPITRTHINAGVYVLEPEILTLLKKNEFCDMPSLFIKSQNFRHKIMAYPMHEPWLDVGRPEDLIVARKTK